MKNVLTITLGVMLFCFCDKNIVDSRYNNQDNSEMLMGDYTIHELSFNEKPYAWWIPANFDDYQMDKDSIIIFELEGKQYYHPVQMAQKMIHFIASYYRTDNYRYITLTEKFADKLLEQADFKNDAYYFPYEFDWSVGGFGIVMRAPWFSGMAQGQILSAIARLYEITKNQKYDSVCVKIFNSFKRFKGQHDPWIVHIDEHGYYWIEEYPEHDPNHVLNGFVFALFGLYDYYLLHKDPDVKKYLLAGITTVSDHLVLYRRPDKPSFYCLKYNVFYPEYHLVHTDQIKFLQKLTQDDYIQNMYEIYYQDYHE